MTKKTKLPKVTKNQENEESKDLQVQKKRALPIVRGVTPDVDSGFEDVADGAPDELLFIRPNKDKEEFESGQDKTPMASILGVSIIGEDLKHGRWTIEDGKRKMIELDISEAPPPCPSDIEEKDWFKERAKITLRLASGETAILSLPPFSTKDYSKWRRKCKASGFDHYTGVFDVIPKQITFKSGNTSTLAKFKLIGTVAGHEAPESEDIIAEWA